MTTKNARHNISMLQMRPARQHFGTRPECETSDYGIATVRAESYCTGQPDTALRWWFPHRERGTEMTCHCGSCSTIRSHV
eukprot:4856514-Amphidinium_carterae.1